MNSKALSPSQKVKRLLENPSYVQHLEINEVRAVMASATPAMRSMYGAYLTEEQRAAVLPSQPPRQITEQEAEVLAMQLTRSMRP